MMQSPTNSTSGGFRTTSSASKVNHKQGDELLIGKYHPSVIGQLKYKEYCKGLFEEHVAANQTATNFYTSANG
jgi:hypothetical protein